MRYFAFIAFLAIASLASCNKDNITKKTYVSYELNGASCNGLFVIEDNDDDPLTMAGSSLIVGASGNDPEIVIMTIVNPATNQEVAFQLPAKRGGPFVMLEDSEFFGMGIIDPVNDWFLTSGVENTVSGVSMDITKFKKGNGFLGFAFVEEMEGNFEGIMTYKNEMNEIEQHTVKGDFYYNGTF